MIVKLSGLLGLTLVLGACGSDLNSPPAAEAIAPVQVQVIYHGNRCLATQPGILLIRDAASWANWQSRRKQMSFSASSESDDAAANLDFDQDTIIVISMGQKPTPGYSIEVPQGSVTLQGTSLTVRTVWQQPPEGAILAQVITSPCIAITAPAAQYGNVKIESQNGDIVIDQPI